MRFAFRKSDTGLIEEHTADSGLPGLLMEAWDWMKAILVALAAVMLIHQFAFQVSTVRGDSMQPTLQEGNRLFINKAVGWLGGIQRGDVVIIKDPEDDEEAHPYLVKRVVGISGDRIAIVRGQLYVNGEAVQEPYVHLTFYGESMPEQTVAEGHLFVMGDNRGYNASYDSRSFGSVPLSMLEGKAEWVVWPIGEWKSLQSRD